MPAKQTQKRRPSFSYRPPDALHDEFERRVAESGLSRNAFLTESWHGRNRVRPAETKLLARLLGRCADIADNLRDIKATGAAGNHALLLESIHDRLLEIRSALFLRMGRKP